MKNNVKKEEGSSKAEEEELEKLYEEALEALRADDNAKLSNVLARVPARMTKEFAMRIMKTPEYKDAIAKDLRDFNAGRLNEVLTECKYITQEVLDQLRDAVRRGDEKRFHGILRPIKIGLRLREQTELVRETFNALEETAEWRRLRLADELRGEGYSPSEIIEILREEISPYPALPPSEETSEEQDADLEVSIWAYIGGEFTALLSELEDSAEKRKKMLFDSRIVQIFMLIFGVAMGLDVKKSGWMNF